MNNIKIDPARDVMKAYEIHVSWLKDNKTAWVHRANDFFNELSSSGIRTIQSVFDSVEECLSGKLKFEYLEEVEVHKIYPSLLDTSKSIQDSYLYIFRCTDGMRLGTALVAHTIIQTI